MDRPRRRTRRRPIAKALIDALSGRIATDMTPEKRRQMHRGDTVPAPPEPGG